MTPEEIDRGKYALGEGVTGNVVATGRARIVADLRAEPDFLNRTGRLDPASNKAISFLCVPIRIEGRTAGALSVDKPFEGDEQLVSDHLFLTIIAAFSRTGQFRSIAWSCDRRKSCWKKTRCCERRFVIATSLKISSVIHPAMHEVFATVGQVANSRATVLAAG